MVICVQYNSPEKLMNGYLCEASGNIFHKKQQNVQTPISIFWSKERLKEITKSIIPPLPLFC